VTGRDAPHDLVRFPVPWLVAALAGLLVFGWLAADVEDLSEDEEVDGLVAWDAQVYEWLVPRVPEWAHSVGYVLDEAGDSLVALGISAVASAALWRRRERLEAAFLLGMAFALGALVWTSKLLFARPRPGEGLVEAAGHSFPSGHAAFGAFLGCMLVWIALRHFRGRWVAMPLIAFGVVWTLLMGASRMVLGVHYLTDVMAGAGLGIGVAGVGLAGPDLLRWGRKAVRGARQAVE
jgi:membrane-associated phospholipid phosphatase